MIGRMGRHRRLCRTVLETIVPFAERFASLCPDSVPNWHAPYHLGFITSAATALALAEAPSIGEGALADIQTAVVYAVSGRDEPGAGDAIMHLSTLADPDFMAGCERGLVFATAVLDSPTDQDAVSVGWDAALEELWRAAVLRQTSLERSAWEFDSF